MINPAHCPMIHGGLNINLKSRDSEQILVNNCCLRMSGSRETIKSDLWNIVYLTNLRELNNSGQLDAECAPCTNLENSGMPSLRTGTLEMFGCKTNLSGPERLDLLFDISCNLACRTCGPGASTFWQKHLIENNIQSTFRISSKSRADEMVEILKTLDLSNLRHVTFSGGETLMGQQYWRVAETISELANAARVTLSFQTNGTQPISERNLRLIEQFELVKLNFSLDGAEDQFEYLRWPAEWSQVTENILTLREHAPNNVMFLVEETISIFNVWYQHRLDNWVRENFSTNRLGDPNNHTRHLATGEFSLHNLTHEYADALPDNLRNLIPADWQENPSDIRQMIKTIQLFDGVRNQSWIDTFPELKGFYKRYL